MLEDGSEEAKRRLGCSRPLACKEASKRVMEGIVLGTKIGWICYVGCLELRGKCRRMAAVYEEGIWPLIQVEHFVLVS